jgi:hypothetical protein
LTTLADLKERGEGLTAHCGAPNCGHSKRLPLDLLIARYGAGYNIINETRIAAACKCEKCGHKGAVIHIAANTTPHHSPVSKPSAYAKAKGE